MSLTDCVLYTLCTTLLSSYFYVLYVYKYYPCFMNVCCIMGIGRASYLGPTQTTCWWCKTPKIKVCCCHKNKNNRKNNFWSVQSILKKKNLPPSPSSTIIIYIVWSGNSTTRKSIVKYTFERIHHVHFWNGTLWFRWLPCPVRTAFIGCPLMLWSCMGSHKNSGWWVWPKWKRTFRNTIFVFEPIFHIEIYVYGPPPQWKHSVHYMRWLCIVTLLPHWKPFPTITIITE